MAPAVFFGCPPLMITLRYKSGARARGTPAAPVLNSSPKRRSFGCRFAMILCLLNKREHLFDPKQFDNLSQRFGQENVAYLALA
jgi:hypothetical protein